MTAVGIRRAAIPAGWVTQTLQTRGVQVPPLPQIRRAIAALPEAEVASFKDRLQRVAAGTERAGELEALADWAREVAASRVAANDEGTTIPRKVQAGQTAGKGFHIYGSKGALCFERAEATQARKSYATLLIEAAPATSQAAQWDKKISFRLTRRELPVFAASLLGWCAHVEFTGHGEDHVKTLELEDQGASLYLKLRHGRRLVPVPIPADEVFDLAAMVLDILCSNAPGLDSQTVLQLVKRAGAMAEMGRRPPVDE